MLREARNILTTHPDHKLFVITSKLGAYKLELVEGEVVSTKMRRPEWFRAIAKDGESAAVFHYDIISEGIDIDGFTGVHFMRLMNGAKVRQTIGRALRRYKRDLSKKKYSLITVAAPTGDRSDFESLKQVITALRDSGIEVDPEVVSIRLPRGKKDVDDLDPIEENTRRLATLIHNVETEIEQEADIIIKHSIHMEDAQRAIDFGLDSLIG